MENITTIEQVQEAMKSEIETATGAENVEVTIREDIMIYLEGTDLQHESAMVDLMKQAGRNEFSVSRYEEEDCGDGEILPAGATFSFTM